jgi:hypothetical protein
LHEQSKQTLQLGFLKWRGCRRTTYARAAYAAEG